MTIQRNDTKSIEKPSVTVLSRALQTNTAILSLSDGKKIMGRRYIPIGKGDSVYQDKESLFVLAKYDHTWIEVGQPWKNKTTWKVADMLNEITFKEIESENELRLFDDLRKFHYRGGGGAGRTVPLIAVTNIWDLPRVLGFIELSSSMIANTARKRFFNYPYREANGQGWLEWDRPATKKYSNMIARISRFVIHPEIRGLGLASHFLKAAMDYAAERWHYGGYRPRFLEITADMLRYYKFVGKEFVYMGETEGNEHRISKDMAYLVKKALSPEGTKAMPQGGGGIMTLQRGYASQLIKYMQAHSRSLVDVVNSLHYEPERLDQETWEALYRLNRRPKPCYTAGLTDEAREYLFKRGNMLPSPSNRRPSTKVRRPKSFVFKDVAVSVQAKLTQTNNSRRIQDAFGFVGSQLEAKVIQSISFELIPGTVTLVCGASGSGKSLLGLAVTNLCEASKDRTYEIQNSNGIRLKINGCVTPIAHVAEFEPLDDSRSPLEQITNTNLEKFIAICAKCGLAEPQLFVRSVSSLSSGQKYRLQLARAVLAEPDILQIDNFCEPLDRHTVVAVCKGLRGLAAELGIAVMVSTAAYERLLEILQPHQFILLRRGNPPIVRASLDGVIHEV